MSQPYYSKEIIDLLKTQLDTVSPETWHKIMNPLCGVCMAERGRALIEGRVSWKNTPLNTK